MKILFNTDFSSNEYWDGTGYTLLTLDRKDLTQMRKLIRAARRSLRELKKISTERFFQANVRVDLPGRIDLFDDNDGDTIATLLKKEPFKVLPDDWEIPSGCEQATCDIDKLSIWSDSLFIESTSDCSSDYVGTEIGEKLMKSL